MSARSTSSPTAVAIFDRSQAAGFRQRRLSPAVVARRGLSRPASRPIPEILDRLRAARRLPEQADFRAWKAALLAAYQRSIRSRRSGICPTGARLRVVIDPNPQGGVTYLFDDVTERFTSNRNINALDRVQSETLDTLEGRRRGLRHRRTPEIVQPGLRRALAARPEPARPTSRISMRSRSSARRSVPTRRSGATSARSSPGLHDARTGFERRMARTRRRRSLDCAAAPLPDGAHAPDLHRRDRRASTSSAR